MKQTSKSILLISVLFIVVTFFKMPALSQELTATQREVWELEEVRWKAWVQGDLVGYLRDYREDGSFWPYWSDEPMNLAKLKELMAQRGTGFSAELKPLSIKIVGNVAILQYTYKVTGPGGTVYARVTSIRMKQDGVWQVIGHMFSRSN